MPESIPAGAGEKMQYAVHTANDNTIRFVLRYPGPLSADCLCAAAHALAMSADVLHAAFDPYAPKACWRVRSALAPADCFTLLLTEGDPMAAAKEAALHPVAPQGNAQLHVTLVSGPDACAVAFAVSHLVVDGGDAKFLLHALAAAYNSLLRTGRPDGIPTRTGSRAPEQAYAHLTARERRMLLQNPMSPIRSRFPFPDETGGEPRMTYRILPTDTFSAARQRAKEAGATANDLLLAAFYRAYAALNAGPPDEGIAIMSMMDLRIHLQPGAPAPGLCNLSGTLPTALPQGVRGGFGDTLAEIAAQTRAAKGDPLAGLHGMPILHRFSRALPLPLLEKAAARVYGGMPLGMTNLGSFSAAQLALGGVQPDALLFAGPLKKKPAMQICAATLDGACTLCAAGRHTAQDAQALARFLAAMAAQIEACAAG